MASSNRSARLRCWRSAAGLEEHGVSNSNISLIQRTQFGNYHQVGHYSHKPRWRPDGYGFGEPFPTCAPIIDFVREMVEMVLTWKDHSAGMLCDLVERLHDLTDADQARVWALIEAWAKAKASDADKTAMREKVRVSILSRRAALLAKKNAKASDLANAGKAAYAALEPSDLLNKHAWLFRDGWVEESADEIEDTEKIDFRMREERIQTLRTEALHEIRQQRGLAGLLELSEREKASWVIGVLAASTVLPEHELRDLLRFALTPILSGREEVHSHKNLIAGALRAIVDDDKREAVIKGVSAGLSEEDAARLLILAPYRKSTWMLVDAISETAQAKYWSEVAPNWIHNSRCGE